MFAATSCDAAAPNTSGSNRFSSGSWPDTAAWREAQAVRQVWEAVDGEIVKDRQEAIERGGRSRAGPCPIASRKKSGLAIWRCSFPTTRWSLARSRERSRQAIRGWLRRDSRRAHPGVARMERECNRFHSERPSVQRPIFVHPLREAAGEIGSCFVGQMRPSSSEGIDENEKRRVDRVHAQEKSFGL